MRKLLTWVLGLIVFIGVIGEFRSPPGRHPQATDESAAAPPVLTASQLAIRADNIAKQGRQLLTDVQDGKLPAQTRLNQLQELARAHPALLATLPPDFQARLEALAVKEMVAFQEAGAKVAREQAKAEAAAKKKLGVHLGMSPEDVIASSWGRPERVNRTTTALGTREQWVYPSRNYLYFRNGQLEAIQN